MQRTLILTVTLSKLNGDRIVIQKAGTFRHENPGFDVVDTQLLLR